MHLNRLGLRNAIFSGSAVGDSYNEIIVVVPEGGRRELHTRFPRREYFVPVGFAHCTPHTHSPEV